MAERGVIVRRLESIENFGSMDILCTDKTGTLTQGVVQLDGAPDMDGKPSTKVQMLAFINASMQSGLSNPLDDAIVQQNVAGLEEYCKVDEIPYDFIRKRLSVVVRHGDSNYLMITKGALENVLSVCTRVQIPGAEAALGEAEQTRIRQRFEAWSEQGYRVLGVAIREVIPQETFLFPE